ncbi:uncharacterized protein BHQ10_000812 [Talaromyces amestolkiae]|uniref:DASH complex subunit DUO1 n=1 Tax=Talaromyces amestolkiae TaxID=1196081 RepID=A0A364KMM3_TALAM|nr:uncharacterized protein BHQ10_000812 [Talaromyces amestolkiae]RAO64800.1 hypothetical protein BHQ10_000812 [Talaromyces amestolkiae]
MATPNATEEMERLQLSDEDTEELWNSPSQRRARQVPQRTPASGDRLQNQDIEPSLDQEEARELALRSELQTVRNVNLAIEGVLESLERARGNMETVSRTVDSASTLLNTWTRILAQTEHNQRLLLNPQWQGASHDIAEMESEAVAKQQAVERRERELQERREAAARKAEQEEKARAAATTATGRGRGTTRARVYIENSSTSFGGINATSSQRDCPWFQCCHSWACASSTIIMNFAPYQDESPEVERALSPPPPFSTDPTNRTRSPSQNQYNNNNRQQQQQQQRSTPPPYQASPTSHFYNPSNGGYGYQESTAASASWTDPESQQQNSNGYGGARADLDAFETSLPLRVDYEAMLAYLLLPPAGGVFLLLFEHKSDYVRFHAWQSSMLFSAIFVLHLIFSWSSIISWLMFIGDIVLIAFLSLHAYQDVYSLDHYEVPIFGRLANSFVDDE